MRVDWSRVPGTKAPQRLSSAPQTQSTSYASKPSHRSPRRNAELPFRELGDRARVCLETGLVLACSPESSPSRAVRLQGRPVPLPLRLQLAQARDKVGNIAVLRQVGVVREAWVAGQTFGRRLAQEPHCRSRP